MSDESMSDAERQWRDWFQLLATEAPDWDLETIQCALVESLMPELQERLDAAEREREAFAERVFRHGFSDGWTANQKGRLAASASVDEAWHFYVADGALQKSVALTANHSAPVVEG